MQQALARAWRSRQALHDDPETDAYRLLDGGHEGLPGWTVDRYGDAVRLRRYHREDAPDELEALLAFYGERLGPAVELWHAPARGPSLPVGAGPLPGPDPLAPDGGAAPEGAPTGHRVVRERGLRFGVDLAFRNPGLFLDARPVRAWVRAHAADRNVLNLFAYTCTIGVAAELGGARSVQNVDLVPSALERGRANFRLNGLPSDARTHLREDVFRFLKRAIKEGRTWDGVVVDPPPVRTEGRGRKGGGFDPDRDWPRLLDLARGCLAPGGWLLALASQRRPTPVDALPEDPEAPARGPDFPGPPDAGLRVRLLRG